MKFDTENIVVQLCSKGMQAEAAGNVQEAHHCFLQAWSMARTDFEAFTAAHYLARHQKTPEENLKWNREALDRALLIDEEGMKAHYPSLYLNVGKSHETMGNLQKAAHNYQLAQDYSMHLPPGDYANVLKAGINAAIQRTGTGSTLHAGIDALIDRWCARRDLRPLSLLLPAYLGHTGTDTDRNRLISALSHLAASRCLPDAEQQQVTALVAELM